jgi:hypothetical protein
LPVPLSGEMGSTDHPIAPLRCGKLHSNVGVR